MKYDIKNHKLVEIDREWINQLLVFGQKYHPELLPPVGDYGYINALNFGKAINKLAEVYFKEVFRAF